MNKTYELFEHGTDAVFGTNADGHIRYLNRTCEKLLRISLSDMKGRKCADLLCGHDLQGNKVCGDHCTIPKTIGDKNQAVRDYDLMVKRADGDSILVNIGINYIPANCRGKDDDITAFFSLRRINCQRLLQRMHNESSRMAARNREFGNFKLTSREAEILGLAANGLKASQIAQRLSISKVTVGNHFKNIYPKIGVHSRVEAVSFALRNNLIQHRTSDLE